VFSKYNCYGARINYSSRPFLHKYIRPALKQDGASLFILSCFETNKLGDDNIEAVFLRCFRNPIRVPRIREIGSLQVHNEYLIFSLKKADIGNKIF